MKSEVGRVVEQGRVADGVPTGRMAALAKIHHPSPPSFFGLLFVGLLPSGRFQASHQSIPPPTELLRYRSRPIVGRMSPFKASPSL